MAHHYYFPRPYPDELIGSLILRACRHRGLSLKSMAARMIGSCRDYFPLVMSSSLVEIASAMELDATTLLWEHTIFPYATAFMSEAETNRLAKNLLGHNANAALTQGATQGSLGQRFCLACLREDAALYGEVYWHREHNLPFILVCRKHNLPLQVIEHQANRSTRNKSAIQCLPETRLGKKQVEPTPRDLAQAINELSAELLTNRYRREPAEWCREYRNLASSKGLMRKGTGLSSLAFAQAFRGVYGPAFLQATGLDFQQGNGAWPTLMLREKQGIPYITPKHVLLSVFLEKAEIASTEVQYRPPGPIPRDYSALDVVYSRKVSKAIKAAQHSNIRVEVTQMLADLGILKTFRHYYDQLPKTRALLTEFRRTSLSARQIGRRPRKKP